MSDFPTTQIEHLTVSRMLIGTNWFLGFSHTSKAQDRMIVERQTADRIAEVISAFLEGGINAIYGVRPGAEHLLAALERAEDATGTRCVRMGTPQLDLSGTQEAADENARLLDDFAASGCDVCLPHASTTDALLDRRAREVRQMDVYVRMIRERGMVPGLSTHHPETIVYADERGLDVGTYIQIYNAAGFLMPYEIDWTHRIIHEAKHPVITIKPLAAGRLIPLVGLAFSWSTIRPQDMICIGCLTGDEAREVVEISRAQLARRPAQLELQATRSKASLQRE